MTIEHMSDQEKRETIKEAQILKNLNHPNITKFVEVYLTKQGKLKIVMEYA
jgi:NIMA (never in mitosis gene a)-related kinase 1/4/5